jgi:F0F1-type ATP synthase assembly protein I
MEKESNDFENQEEKQFEKDLKDGFYQTDKEAEPDTETTRKGLDAYAAVGTLIGGILFFLGIGWLADKYFQTSPWGMVAGIIFGAIVGFYQFVKIANKDD